MHRDFADFYRHFLTALVFSPRLDLRFLYLCCWQYGGSVGDRSGLVVRGVIGPCFESRRGHFCVYRDGYCDMQSWSPAAHRYCRA